MGTCKNCGTISESVAEILSLCANCICQANKTTLIGLEEIHIRSRKKFGLPTSPPCAADGIDCALCQNNCKIPIGGMGYCGIRKNQGQHLVGGTADGAAVSWYYDPLPTNCVADWVCAGGIGAGYPKWSHRHGPEHGFLNLAVFMKPVHSTAFSVKTGTIESIH